MITDIDQNSIVKKIIHTRLTCGKNILELSNYENISMWWAVHSMFTNILIESNYFPISNVKALMNFDKIGESTLQNIYYYILNKLVRSFDGLSAIKSKDKDKDKIILFYTSNVNWRQTLDYSSGKYEINDVHFFPLFRALENKNYRCACFNNISTSPIKGLKVYRYILQNKYLKNSPIEVYYDAEIQEIFLSSKRYYRRNWDIIQNDSIFISLCNELSAEIRNKIIFHLNFYFNFLFPFLVKQYELFNKMIKHQNVSIFILINEYGWLERTYLAAAKARGIPVLAIQHGIIDQNHSGYKYGEGEITGSYNSPHCPIPDFTAVNGGNEFDILVRGSFYPANSVVITGQPRYDQLLQANVFYDRQATATKYGIDNKDNILLWTTQCHGMSDLENENNLICIFNTMKHINNTTLIIKQHPGEPKIYTKIIKKYMKKYKNNKIILTPKNADTNELINCCDILITKTSTTAIEAAMMGKKLILLDLSNDKKPLNFFQDFNVATVNSESELLKTILRASDKSRQLQNREISTTNSIFSDGNASTRIVNIISKVVQ